MKKNVLRRSLTSSSLPINLDQPIIKLDYYPPGKLKPLHRKAKQYPLSSSTENFSKEDGEADFSVKVKKYTRNSTKASLEQLSFIAKTSVIEEDRESVSSKSHRSDKYSATAIFKDKTFLSSKDKSLISPQGKGSYEYDNKFFKYEGQWKNGKKHGMGKLTFSDGGYYEGTFVNGEITGFGTRFFPSTGCKYQGQLVKGELWGKGRMTWPDGSIFEGQWESNKRHGFGVMKSIKENCLYKGSYVGNRRHGQGTMIYPLSCLTNPSRKGDRYNGDWENDLRHGEGDMRFTSGTVYEGHFEDDTFQGDGLMRHCSGLMYRGVWDHGKPSKLPNRIAILNPTGKEFIEITQGQPFSIQIQCVDQNGDVIEADNGRELRITAGFKHIKAKKGTAIFDLIEEYEEKPMDTPYYQVLQYPLTDFIMEEEEVVEEMKEEAEDTIHEQETTAENSIETTLETPAEEPERVDSVAPEMETPQSVAEEGLERTASTLSTADTQSESMEKESRPLPPPVTNKRTENGICDWSNIQLAQAPPRFPPFVALDEEEKKTRARQDRQDLLRRTRYSVTGSMEAKRMNRIAQDDRFARIGEYILMVHDVTSPPFMDQRLEPAFIQLKLKKPKREKKTKETKPKWDTSQHINKSMMRS
ncbi:MORN repeat-containing protein 1-like isoform X3 [Mya arenaria]|uniref:MORN repeat-containing protein 1-like isoform X3 n=1 Tax=Mya arenaria TaxID=6604 RepID=UPI0022E204D1|nr:MORN repeat-containing protein 1-like isoform X3 [Mya arenaria]